MPIPDNFDPTMMLNTTKVVGGEQQVPSTPGDASREPGDVNRFDPTANTGTIPRDVEFPGSEKPLSTTGISRQPADVQTFNSSGGL